MSLGQYAQNRGPASGNRPRLGGARRRLGIVPLAARSLDEAIEYAGHAGLHAAIVSDALGLPDAGDCPG